MSIRLRTLDRQDNIEITWTSWCFMLQKALANGWRPAGTIARWANWSGTYLTNDGQMITAQDAAALRNALNNHAEQNQQSSPAGWPGSGARNGEKTHTLQRSIDRFSALANKGALIIE